MFKMENTASTGLLLLRLRLVARQRKVLNIMHIAIVKVPVATAAHATYAAAIVTVSMGAMVSMKPINFQMKFLNPS